MAIGPCAPLFHKLQVDVVLVLVDGPRPDAFSITGVAFDTNGLSLHKRHEPSAGFGCERLATSRRRDPEEPYAVAPPTTIPKNNLVAAFHLNDRPFKKMTFRRLENQTSSIRKARPARANPKRISRLRLRDVPFGRIAMAETAVENRSLHGSRQEQNIQNHHPHRRPLHFYCFRNGICRFARPPPRSLCTGRSQKRMTK